MAVNKWIGGVLGFASGGVLGAIAGFVIGSLIDSFAESNVTVQDNASGGAGVDEGTRNGFLFALMVLSAHIIQADGKIMHSEMELVRRFLRNSFGESAVSQGNGVLLNLFEYRKQRGEAEWNRQVREVCAQIARALPEEQRLQLVGFLAEVAKADGRADKTELQALYEVADGLQLARSVVDQMFAVGGTTLEEAYAVLGLTPDATDDEVRKAYKKMMIQYHPDRVANLGEDVRQAATLKAQEINKAKDMIYKSRGM